MNPVGPEDVLKYGVVPSGSWTAVGRVGNGAEAVVTVVEFPSLYLTGSNIEVVGGPGIG